MGKFACTKPTTARKPGRPYGTSAATLKRTQIPNQARMTAYLQTNNKESTEKLEQSVDEDHSAEIQSIEICDSLNPVIGMYLVLHWIQH